jgi:hypothetical protein
LSLASGLLVRTPPPEATSGSGIIPACPLTTATGGLLAPPEQSPATGATPRLWRIAAARLTARSCAAGPRASRSQLGRRPLGRRTWFPGVRPQDSRSAA